MFPNHIKYFTTCDDLDFSLKDESCPLNEEQLQFLKKKCSFEKIVSIKQTHGVGIICIDEKNKGTSVVLGEYDAVMTKCPDVAITVRTADCLPIFIHDSRQDAIALVHVGWRGAKDGILKQTIQSMQDHWSTQVQDLKIQLGPSIQQCCYQVSENFQTFFPDFMMQKDQFYYFNLQGFVHDQLQQLGVVNENILLDQPCTCCGQIYFSYRRDGDKSGRMLSLMTINKGKV